MHGPTLRPALAVLLLLGQPQLAAATFESARGWEVVSIEGRNFPAAFRAAVGRLTVWRVAGGSLQPIRLQVDERDESGQLALPNGPSPSQDESPGVFDDNDLLVFAARDLGDRAIVRNAAEIQVTDPLSGESRWAYARLDAGAPRRTSGEVEYDAAARLVRARDYSLTLGTHVPTAFRFMDGHHAYGRNLLDRLKVRVTAHILWGLLRTARLLSRLP